VLTRGCDFLQTWRKKAHGARPQALSVCALCQLSLSALFVTAAVHRF
jgi:hypothetical protein